jgi:hypothetical protein
MCSVDNWLLGVQHDAAVLQVATGTSGHALLYVLVSHPLKNHPEPTLPRTLADIKYLQISSAKQQSTLSLL